MIVCRQREPEEFNLPASRSIEDSHDAELRFDKSKYFRQEGDSSFMGSHKSPLAVYDSFFPLRRIRGCADRGHGDLKL